MHNVIHRVIDRHTYNRQTQIQTCICKYTHHKYKHTCKHICIQNNCTTVYIETDKLTNGQTDRHALMHMQHLNYLPRVLSDWCISTGTLESSDSTLNCLLYNAMLTHTVVSMSITFPTGRLMELEYS